MATQWHAEDLIDSVPAMNRLFSDPVARGEVRARRLGDAITRGSCLSGRIKRKEMIKMG